MNPKAITQPVLPSSGTRDGIRCQRDLSRLSSQMFSAANRISAAASAHAITKIADPDRLNLACILASEQTACGNLAHAPQKQTCSLDTYGHQTPLSHQRTQIRDFRKCALTHHAAVQQIELNLLGEWFSEGCTKRVLPGLLLSFRSNPVHVLARSTPTFRLAPICHSDRRASVVR